MTNERRIELGAPSLGKEEHEVLCKVIDSGWITMGQRVAQFEAAFADMHGVSNGVAVNSCTAGLHLALVASGIGPGDEVLVPSMTFAATVNAVLYCGATPVPVDIVSVHEPHLCLDDAQTAFSEKTRAVIVMHYGGYVMDMEKWKKKCDERGVLLIEDAAHAPLGAGVGLFSHCSVFSFYTNKNMTTSEGGMVLTNDDALSVRMKRMRSHGMTKSTLQRDKGQAFSYDIVELGYNYRMDELRAAMGLVQLARLPGWNVRRVELTAHYRSLLAGSVVELIFTPDHQTCAHIFPVLLPEGTDRENVMASLLEQGIQSSIHYPPIHLLSYHSTVLPERSLPHTETFAGRELTLPLHPELSENDVAFTCQALLSILTQASRQEDP